MLRAGITALLSHWVRRPFQLAMLLTGLSLATALWTGVQAVNQQARSSYDQASRELVGEARAQLSRQDGAPIALEIFRSLRSEGVLVSPVIAGDISLAGKTFRLTGIDPLTIGTTGGDAGAPAVDDLPAFLGPDGYMLISPSELAGLPLSERAILRGSASVAAGQLIADIARAERMLDMEGSLSHLILDPAQDEASARRAAARYGLVMSGGREDLSRLTDSFHLNLTAFALLSFAVGLFIVYAATGLSFEQRRPVFRTLRALGFPLSGVMAISLLELFVLALAAGAAGTVMGYLLAGLLLPDVSATLRGLYGADIGNDLKLRWQWWAAGIGISLFGAAAASAQSLWRLARMPILASSSSRAWARTSSAEMRSLAFAGGALLTVSLMLYLVADSLIDGIVLMGALLIGAALCLPALLGFCLRRIELRARTPLALWFFADARMQISGVSLALMALLLALATNIGVGTMVGSFRQTFLSWLDQRLAAEAYITPSDAEQADALQAWLEGKAEIVLPVLRAETRVGEDSIETFGVVRHQTYEDAWPLLQGDGQAWPDVWENGAALVNEQFSYRFGLRTGDILQLADDWSVRIAGVYSDYGNPSVQMIVSREVFDQRFPGVAPSGFGVRTDPAQAPELLEEARRTFALPPGAALDQAGMKARARAIFERTFRITAALNLLTLGVAALALFASLATLSDLRAPQIAPVWASGVRLSLLTRLEVARIVFLAFLTFLVSLPTGLALAHILLSVVNVEAFGWRLPMRVFPVDWLGLGFIAGLAALLAAIIPVRSLARGGPARLLRLFSP